MARNQRKEEKKGITRREFIRGSAAIGVAASVGGLGFPHVLRGAAPPDILIGELQPLSGSNAYDGQMQKKASLLAIDEINEAGGIKALGGAKLKLLDADSEGKPDRAISEVERLSKAGVIAITGCLQSAVTIVATQIAEKFRVPFVVAVAVADEVTARGFKFTFRVQPSAEQMGSLTVKYISEIAKEAGQTVKTIAYLHDDTAFGVSLFGHVIKNAPKYGLQVIADVPYSPRSADVSTEVGKIKAAGADLVFSTGYTADQMRVYASMNEQRIKTKAFVGCGNGAFSDMKFAKELGAITEYVMDGNYAGNPKSPLAQKMFANYKKVYGQDMAPSQIFAYVPIYVMADALERAKSTDREAIREALSKTNITQHVLPQGPIAFGPDGQNKNAASVMHQILKGKVQVVWPKEYAEAKVVFPIPA